MTFIFGALRHPLPDRFLLRLGESLVRIFRRHDFGLIAGENAPDDFALLWLARDDGNFPVHKRL